MSFIYITGISGSGKSTVMRELKNRGYEAHGVDEEGFADWVDRESGEVVPFPQDDTRIDVHEWYRRHRWVLSEDRIGKLKDESDNRKRITFLAGSAEGEDKVWHLFDKVIALSVEEATIRRRIGQRQDNDFGKTPEEMADILTWLKHNDDNYRSFGAFVIDATRPVDEVVDEIIAIGRTK